jgi:phospholysine phosphohistidine inorganic pyrophosphate phosphatase
LTLTTGPRAGEALPSRPTAILVDIDGVLYVGDEPVPGAARALECLRSIAGVRLLTNTTSRSRGEVLVGLRGLGFEAEPDELLTPSALAVGYCRERGLERVALLVPESLREDLAGLTDVGSDEGADAVILGDLGEGFTPAVLNRALAQLLDGAQLIALQHNRVYRRKDGIVLDVGAYAAALEYASGRDSVVIGKPAPAFFAAALADLGADRVGAVMIGDDVEADVGGAIDAGLAGILVRTGKYRPDLVARSAVQATATVDSIADVCDLFSLPVDAGAEKARRPT